MNPEGIVEAKHLTGRCLCSESRTDCFDKAVELSYDKKVNVDTDLRYALLILDAHGSVWEKRGLLTCNKREN